MELQEVAEYYKGDPDGGYVSYVYTDHLSGEEIVLLRDEMEKEVRRHLGIPWNQSRPALRFEHSMGQGGELPPFIWRKDNPSP
jgi:hypothetical protein